MHQDLVDIRSQLSAALARVDRLLAGVIPPPDPATLRYRISPGGPLSREGEAEMYRRFREGEANAVIARAMGVTVQGAQKRRVHYNATYGAAALTASDAVLTGE